MTIEEKQLLIRDLYMRVPYYIKGKEDALKDKDLEEEIERWIDENHFIFTEIDEIIETAHHFAEWQRKKDVEEMMKTLVEGEIVKDIHNQLKVTSEPLNDTFGKFGDKVKIIIVKEE